jgi:hypothetical protein
MFFSSQRALKIVFDRHVTAAGERIGGLVEKRSLRLLRLESKFPVSVNVPSVWNAV